MDTAELFINGQNQAVRLPNEYRFVGNEVNITRIGEAVVLYQKGNEDALFFSSLGNFTDDFFETVKAAREESAFDVPRASL